MATAEERQWLSLVLPRELIRVIAEYFCSMLHVWNTASIDPNRYGLPFRNFTFPPPHAWTGPDSVSQNQSAGGGKAESDDQSTTVVVASEYGWNRLWGLYSFGSGRASPYFAVRISNVHIPVLPKPQCNSVSDQSVMALNVGVSRRQSANYANYYGVESADYAVMSSRRAVFDSRYRTGDTFMPRPVDPRHTNSTKEPHGMVAVTNAKIISRILSTTATKQTQRVAPAQWIGQAGEGFAVVDHSKPVVVGIDCDLTTNTMRVFVDDRVLRVTPESYGGSEGSLTDAGFAVGDPYVWNIPNLEDCYPLISCFHCAATIELVNDWVPPAHTSDH